MPKKGCFGSAGDAWMISPGAGARLSRLPVWVGEETTNSMVMKKVKYIRKIIGGMVGSTVLTECVSQNETIRLAGPRSPPKPGDAPSILVISRSRALTRPGAVGESWRPVSCWPKA